MAIGVPCMMSGMASLEEMLKASDDRDSSGIVSVTASSICSVCSVASGTDSIAAAPVIAVP